MLDYRAYRFGRQGIGARQKYCKGHREVGIETADADSIPFTRGIDGHIRHQLSIGLNLQCSKKGVHESAAMWLFDFFMKGYSGAVFLARLCLRQTLSSITSKPKGKMLLP